MSSSDAGKVMTVTSGETAAATGTGPMISTHSEIEPLRQQQQQQKPVDRCYIVYMIFVVHGVGVLMPWNMFINANDYFVKYKLAPVSPPGEYNATDGETPTGYQVYFLNVLGFVAQIPNILLSGINLFCQFKGGNQRARITASIIIVLIMFLITVILAVVDSSNWPGAFFWITMTTVVIINMANGVYQNNIYGIAANLPMKYTNAVITGNNASGTFTAIVNIIAVASAPDIRLSAVYYFIAAIVVLLFAFVTIFLLHRIPFFQHHSFSAMKKSQELDAEPLYSRPPYWLIFKKCWVHDLCVFFVFFVTLSCFPALQASTEPLDPDFVVSKKYFGAVTCFLFFNMFALIGNFLSSFVHKPGPKWVWIPILLRVLFIPFFMLCNVKPSTRLMPVWFNDYVYCAGAILMALTSGYFSSLSMMYAPRNVARQHQIVAAMMAAFFLVLGIFCGVVFSTPAILIIQHLGTAPAVIHNTTHH